MPRRIAVCVGVRLARQQVTRLDHQARRAEPALHRATGNEAVAQAPTGRTRDHALDGHQLAPVAVDREHQAGIDADAPSTSTVQAPHSPSPQPYLVPVRPR